MAEEEPNVCTICGKPVLPGQAFHGITKNHYACEKPAGSKTLKEFVEDIDNAIAKCDEIMAGMKQRLEKRASGLNRVDGPGWRRRNR